MVICSVEKREGYRNIFDNRVSMSVMGRVARWGTLTSSVKSFSDNEATASVASLIFLKFRINARALGFSPVSAKPAEIAKLDDNYPGVHKDQVAVCHRGKIEESMPGHFQ